MDSEKLSQLHLILQELFLEVEKITPIVLVEAHRSPERQHELFVQGKTQLDYPPGGKHNKYPSEAADVYPHPIPANLEKPIYLQQMCFVAGIAIGVAVGMNAQRERDGQSTFRLRWGCDWNKDGSMLDNSFMDYAHFELELDE